MAEFFVFLSLLQCENAPFLPFPVSNVLTHLSADASFFLVRHLVRSCNLEAQTVELEVFNIVLLCTLVVNSPLLLTNEIR